MNAFLLFWIGFDLGLGKTRSSLYHRWGGMRKVTASLGVCLTKGGFGFLTMSLVINGTSGAPLPLQLMLQWKSCQKLDTNAQTLFTWWLYLD
jgi:hypothetical protein